MARPDILVAGNCYFSVGFYDRDLLLPRIDTLLYVGQEDYPEHGRMWLFKEPDAPTQADEPGPPQEPEPLIAFSDQQLFEILDFPGLIRWIQAAAVDHPLKSPLQADAVPPTDAEFGSLSAEIAEFLTDPEYLSLTITLRFTDDGLSLGRTDNGYQMHFFTQPRLDPDEDSKILSFFEALDLHPTEDYFSDGGRTRLLEFAISGDFDSIVQLCRRVLSHVYAMRQGDVLDYHFRRKADLVGKDTKKPE